MKELMCMIHHCSKAADNAFTSAFKPRKAPSTNPAVKVTEATTALAPRPAAARIRSDKPGKAATTAQPESRRTSTSSRPSVCHDELTRADMYEALDALGATVPHTEYAVIGGIACILLGHKRETMDVDIIVPDGQAARIAEMLSRSPKFGTEKMASGRRRCWFNASSHNSYNVDVLEPHDIGQVLPSGALDTVLVAGRPVLAPAQLLNYKMLGWTDRMCTTGYKKASHARDILFLADYMARKGMRVSREEVYHATDDFLVLFCASHPEATQLFERIGLVRRGSSARSSAKSGKTGWIETSRFKSGGLLSP